MELDSIAAAAEPRCAECGVVMRGVEQAYVCPACGRREDLPQIPHPGEGTDLIEFPAWRRGG